MLGYLYVDIDGAFGRFHDADRDLMAMLAARRPSRSTTRSGRRDSSRRSRSAPPSCTASNAKLEQRSDRARDHQQHPAGHRRRARLPGDRRSRRRQAARSVRTPTTWASAGSTRRPGCSTTCTTYEHGKRLQSVPRDHRRPSGAGTRRMLRRASRSSSTRARTMDAMARLLDRQAPTLSRSLRRSCRSSPATGCWASSTIENYERENAFGEADVRLLRRSPRAWASRSRTRACSTRRSAC